MDRLDMRCCVSLFPVDCSTSPGGGLFTLVSTQRTTQSPTFWLIENCWAAVAAAAAAAGSAGGAAAGGAAGGCCASATMGSAASKPAVRASLAKFPIMSIVLIQNQAA